MKGLDFFVDIWQAAVRNWKNDAIVFLLDDCKWNILLVTKDLNDLMSPKKFVQPSYFIVLK